MAQINFNAYEFGHFGGKWKIKIIGSQVHIIIKR